MTNNKIRIAAAEMLGWSLRGDGRIVNPAGQVLAEDFVSWPPRWLSNPVSDHRAAHELFMTLDDQKRQDAVRFLCNEMEELENWGPDKEQEWDAVRVAARVLAAPSDQLTTAVLRAAGRWEAGV